MKAQIIRAFGGAELFEETTLPDPEAGAGEVLVRVHASSVNPVDYKVRTAGPEAIAPELPAVLGCDIAGEVIALGADVSDFKIGDAVYGCAGGVKGMPGAYAELFAADARLLAHKPKSLDMREAAALPLVTITAWEGLFDRANLAAGQSVLVNGCGPIGLMAVSAARALGAETVIAADPNALRRVQAERSGADHTLDPATIDVVRTISDITDSVGVDVAIEFSGQPDGFRASIASVAKGGDFRLVGAPALPLEIDLTRWLVQCPRIINIHGRRIWESWEAATKLVRDGKVDLAPIRSHVLPLSEGLRGFDLILKGEALKPILIPD